MSQLRTRVENAIASALPHARSLGLKREDACAKAFGRGVEPPRVRRRPSHAAMAAMNKCLAQSNKSPHGGQSD